jgi:phosphate transport system permease protein
MNAPRAADGNFRPRLALRRASGWLFVVLCVLLTLMSLSVLGILIYRVFEQGGHYLSMTFLTNNPSDLDYDTCGVKSPLIGTLWLLALTVIVAVPLGVGAAVYLEEYASKNWFTNALALNIANLAGVPSIVYGLLGATVFVRFLAFDRSVLAAGLTLALLVLPVVIISSREALRAVPSSLRQAALALGATRWQTIRAHVLPAAIPGIMTGVILAVSRAIGEAAPLILIGVSATNLFLPGQSYEGPMTTLVGVSAWLKDALFDPFSAMPVQIHYWTDRPQEEFSQLAAAAIIVLLGVLFSLNAVAIGIRAWQQRKKAW